MECAPTIDLPATRQLADSSSPGASGKRTLGLILKEVVDLGDRAVEGSDSETLIGSVQDQVLTHDGETDEAEICFQSVSATPQPNLNHFHHKSHRLRNRKTSSSRWLSGRTNLHWVEQAQDRQQWQPIAHFSQRKVIEISAISTAKGRQQLRQLPHGSHDLCVHSGSPRSSVEAVSRW